MIYLKNFVRAKWLVDNIDKDNIVVLDASAGLNDPLEGINSYRDSHIKGAHFVSLEEVSTGKIGEFGGRHPLPDLEKFLEEMRKLGVNNDSKIIIYDDGNIAMAGRLWWLLKYIGKEDVYILIGGKEAYKEAGGDLTKDLPGAEEEGDLSLKINKDIKVDMEEVKERIGDKDTAIVDVRAHERYIGEVEPLDSVAGHIKGALNYPWTEFLQDKDIRDMESIEDKLKDLKDYKEIIVHCGSGITGTVAVLMLDEIGVDAKLYAGGYSDWVSYKDNEVFQGES